MLNISYYNAMRLAVPVALAALLAVPSAAREAAKGDSLAVKGGRAKGRVWLTPGQALKGQAAGVYVAEPSAEPGTKQTMLLRGLTAPVASFYDLSRSQPAVYINGVPVLDDNQLFRRSGDLRPSHKTCCFVGRNAYAPSHLVRR